MRISVALFDSVFRIHWFLIRFHIFGGRAFCRDCFLCLYVGSSCGNGPSCGRKLRRGDSYLILPLTGSAGISTSLLYSGNRAKPPSF
ncbi:hypothetical protein SeMB42_g04818 [Synchytrium endobioticum]|uniref:Uncharacterized protein n=1 Tax=Synchytrium endobioticum TaxID=286115 RepID=A0A507CW01_9FUNG|nr:hypothetical protein SeMB42_g04818 [Synchytrium endobioticum]